MRKIVLLLPIVAWLTACASAQPVQIAKTCPTIPPLDPLPPGALEHDFIGRMESFLSGRLPEPASFRPNYELAAPGTKLPAQR